MHALSDCHAMGADAQTALALAVVPYSAEEAITESTLLSMLAGASDALGQDDCELVGGHTCEGAEQALGFSVTGIVQESSTLLRKQGGRVGSDIILTKPIGTGALFAAHMRVESDGEHVWEALQGMMQSNRKASQVARKYGSAVSACTDVTGFGLVGHLLEMLLANDKDPKLDRICAQLDLENIPFLQGALAASKKRIYSSLHVENSRSRRAISNHVQVALDEPVRYPLLFDPQTAGGLLLFVSPDLSQAILGDLHKSGYEAAAIIGEVMDYDGADDDLNTGVCVVGDSKTTSGTRVTIQYKVQ